MERPSLDRMSFGRLECFRWMIYGFFMFWTLVSVFDQGLLRSWLVWLFQTFLQKGFYLLFSFVSSSRLEMALQQQVGSLAEQLHEILAKQKAFFSLRAAAKEKNIWELWKRLGQRKAVFEISTNSSLDLGIWVTGWVGFFRKTTTGWESPSVMNPFLKPERFGYCLA